MSEKQNALAVADALEAEYLAVANGQKNPGKMDLEPMVRAVQVIRELERASQTGSGELDLPGLRVAIRAFTPHMHDWIGKVIDALESQTGSGEDEPIGYMNDRAVSILAQGSVMCTHVSPTKTEFQQVAIFRGAK